MSVVYFLLLVGVLVVIHELGHFTAAKLLDVKVLRFSLGYGRPLVRMKLRETEYQIAVFPIGGYVRLLGIEGETPNKADAGRSFASASIDRPRARRVSRSCLPMARIPRSVLSSSGPVVTPGCYRLDLASVT